jgi:molybdopterin-guanine dinucleotide biosynthesis protein MobB
MKPVPVIAFVGPHNCGKTSLVERLTRLAARQGIRVGVIKRAGQALQFDQSGKDSARFAAAGATGVVAIGPGSVFFMERPGEPPTIKAVARRFGRDLDLWLAETYFVEPVPWIGVIRAGQQMATPDRYCIGIVAPKSMVKGLPNFSWRRPGTLLQYIMKFSRLEGRRG